MVDAADCGEVCKLFFLPGVVAMQLFCQNCGDARSGFKCGGGIEEDGAGSPAEDVFDGARHFFARGPDNLGNEIR